MYYNIARIYFGAEKYNTANNWLNKIINDTTIDVRSDVLCFAQLFHLIIHYEMDNQDLIGYRVLAVTRFLKNRNRLFRFEKIMLNFFRKILPDISTIKEQIKAFKIFKNETEEILKDPLEFKALNYFNFISWIRSKIEDRPFAEIVREKMVSSNPKKD